MIEFLQLESQYPFLSSEVFGNSVLKYVEALVVFVLVFGVLKFFKSRIINNLHKLSEKTKTDIDDMIVGVIQVIGAPFYLFVSLGVAVQFIDQPPLLKLIVSYLAIAVVILYPRA